jgi:2-iminobutanoate/2-iminopropanoate deaminase
MGRTLLRGSQAALAGLLLVSCAAGSQPSPTANASARELIKPGDSYAAASRFGDLVFTAGHLPTTPRAKIDVQVEEVLDNLEATLEEAGAGFDTLLKINVYLADFSDWDAFNAIYVRRIEKYGLPPRTTIEAGSLCCEGDFLIEIAAIAHVRPPSSTASD